jgi:hypothetical protein
VHRLSSYCLLRDAALTRDACLRYCFPCHHRTGSAFAEPIVVDRVRCLAGRAAALFRSAIPTTPTALAAVPACDTLRVPVCACLTTRTTSANCPAIPFARFFVRLRLPSSSVQGCARFNRDHIPPPPSPFNRPQCVGLHVTVPASCAERVRPCVFESLFAGPELSDRPLTHRLNTQNWAKPPANQMDIACPGSSSWPTVYLI